MNNFWMLATMTLLIGCIVSTLRMRKIVADYQAKIRQLKDKNHALEQYNQDHARIDEIVASVNEAVFRLNGGGRIIAANACARQAFGMADTALPQPMLQIYRDNEWYTLLMQAIDALPERRKLPNIILEKRIFEPRLAQLDSSQSLLLCIDITARHKLEQQRQTFLSNLMHDMKTPLTSLLGYARSMECFGDDPDFRQEAASVIAAETKHVNHLLDALLTLDQVEFAKKDSNASCDAIAIVKKICAMLSPQCQKKQLQWHCEPDDGEILLAVSEDDLDRITTNLLTNAINHSPKHGHIHIRINRQHDHCHISILDEGKGIPDKHLPRVTERFYRVDKARSRQRKSHGLGLAIVKELAESNAGTLTLSNHEPHGLCAEFTLPLKAETT